MSSSIPRTDYLPSSAFDQLSSNLDEIPVTSRDSSSRNAPLAGSPISQASSSVQQSPRSILKSSSSGHTVTTAASEITPLKTVSWDQNLPPDRVGNLTKMTVENVTSILKKEKPKQDEHVLSTSKQVQKTAENIATARERDIETATRVRDKFLNENPSLDEESIAQIKEKFSVVQDHSTKAKKYSDWTTARHSLLQGNKKLAKELQERGYSIGSDWTPKQLQEDFQNAQQEPWNTNDALFDLQKTINSIISKKPSSKSSLTQQTSLEKKQPALHQRIDDSSTDESHEDHVNVPGVGLVDRNIYDIGTVEYHGDDNTYTITDMTGRRYDYPTPARPNDSSCTVS